MSSTSLLYVVEGFEPVPEEPDEPEEPEEPDEPDEPDGCVAGWIVGSTSVESGEGRVVSIPGASGLGTPAAKAVTAMEKTNTQAITAANTFFIGKHQTFH